MLCYVLETFIPNTVEWWSPQTDCSFVNNSANLGKEATPQVEQSDCSEVYEKLPKTPLTFDVSKHFSDRFIVSILSFKS